MVAQLQWNELSSKERMSLIKKMYKPDDTEKTYLELALNDGWVITFPQGTTFKPVRKEQHI
jgi:hypothetical protein